MIRHVETSKTSKKKDRLLNVKGKEMGISGEYRLEYMPLIQFNSMILYSLKKHMDIHISQNI